MFGLKKEPKEPFKFDLEEDLRSDPAKAKEMLKVVAERTNELKNLLRQGAETEDFDDYGVLLHGYAALQKILTWIIEKK